MKKMTLDQTWKECLRQWRWISQQKGDIIDLKSAWVKKNSYVGKNEPEAACFFCEYVNKRDLDCDSCPGRKVDKLFYCKNDSYSYLWKHKAFYNKLRSLNRKRLTKRRIKCSTK